MMAALGIYGLTQAAALRIFNNIMGVLYACLFAWVWKKIIKALGKREQYLKAEA